MDKLKRVGDKLKCAGKDWRVWLAVLAAYEAWTAEWVVRNCGYVAGWVALVVLLVITYRAMVRK